MQNISISLFINVDNVDYYFTGIATDFPPTSPSPARKNSNDYIDVPAHRIKEAKPMATVIPLPTCKLLGG